MLTPSQAKSLETFARHVTIMEAPVAAATPALTQTLLHDLGHDRVVKHEWAYSLFIEIGTGPEDAQGYGVATMTSERSLAALSEAIARFWQQLMEEGAFNAPQGLPLQA